MYIREYKTFNKKTKETYIKHRLVESIWTDKGPRQRIIMNLGQLTLPRMEWKKLAHSLECQLAGQTTLLSENEQYIERLALSLVSNMKLSQQLQIKETNKDEQNLLTIDTNSVQTTQTRSLGAELVCLKAWQQLDFERILTKCGFGKRDIALSRAIIFGKLIAPGSELSTYQWFQKRSALTELPGADISTLCKDMFYDIGDKLYEQKEKLESQLYEQERKLFPHTGETIFLYDLTNTYMEGSCLGNTLAAYGHCKSKRYDCPLITLSLVVDDCGMPIVSHIYEGNQSEPETMPKMISELEALLHDNQQTLIKPTVVMDRGIATEDNVNYLKEHKYPYIVVKREDESYEYENIFKEHKASFTCINGRRKSVYGDDNDVYVKKLDLDDNGSELCKVLCISEGKARKEIAIDSKKEKLFLEDIQKLEKSIFKGTIKNSDKIAMKLFNIAKRHKNIASHYTLSLKTDETDPKKVLGLSYDKNAETNEKLYGCYVLESTHTELTDVALWKLYMTLSRVENAFRTMKSELGMRPVYHQIAARTKAHLFITVLGYHMLATIENLLAKKNDNRQWSTLCKELSTHTRNTVIMKDKDGNVYHIRVSGKPEEIHQDIYDKLGVTDPLKSITSLVNTVSSDPKKL